MAAIGPFYEGWRKADRRLIQALAPLSDEQLALRIGTYWPIWAIAGHVAGGRVYWLCRVFGEPGAETTPFGDPADDGWEDHPDHPRTAAELVQALESSWAIVERCLSTWTADMLAEEVRRPGTEQRHTRQSVLMRLITHEAFHAGEISTVLGTHGLPEIDLWRPDRPA